MGKETKKWIEQAESDLRKAKILFGSRAREKTHKWSDYDIIVVSDKFKKKSFQRVPEMYDYWDYEYPVDFLCYTSEEFNKLKKRVTIVREAVKEGIEIK